MIPRHWTLRYIGNRLREWIFQKKNPGAPWLTPAAVRELEKLLRSEYHGLEFGSGRSTTWLAARCAALVSVEDNQAWHAQVRRQLTEQNLHHVDYRYIPCDDKDKLAVKYKELVQDLPDNGFDFILIDSEHHRDILVNLVVPKLKPGGFLVVDNVNWFLPSDSYSPNSRKQKDGPANELWKQFAGTVQDWHRTWTSSGVTDTAFFFRPAR